AYELHLLGTAGAIGALVTANVSDPARRECRPAFFTHAFQFQRHFVSYSPSNDRKPPHRHLGPISSDDSPPCPRTHVIRARERSLIRKMTSLRRLMLEGFVSLASAIPGEFARPRA